MRKLFGALLLSFLVPTVPVAAQGFSYPPDAGTYSKKNATYRAGTLVNRVGNNSNAKGGLAPAFTTHPEPDESWDVLPTGWVISDVTSADYCLTGTSGCEEKKFRTVANSCPKAFKKDDPIRNWGQPGVAHWHEFYVNCGVNAMSTRLSLRKNPRSVGAGGPALGTGYWEPAYLKQIGANIYGIPGGLNVIYYAETAPNGQPIVDDNQRLHSLLRFIAGTNMDDPDDSLIKAEIAAANAQSGTAGRYSYGGNGFLGYTCLVNNVAVAVKTGQGKMNFGGTIPDTVRAKGFKLADGSDPWEGRCTDGAVIYSEFTAPRCWDGVNVSSPDGYSHFRHEINDSVTGKPVCPDQWYKVPALQAKNEHFTRGWNDYRLWYLSSDEMMRLKLIALGTPRTPLPGESFHFDWMNGWHKPTLNLWLEFCLGLDSTPHACNTSTVSNTKRLQYNASPDGSRNPQVTFETYDPNDITKLTLLQAASKPTTIHMH